MAITPIRIDLSEKFEHLPNAPITEAVIEFRGTATVPWDRKPITEALRTRLPDYPKTSEQQHLTVGLEIKQLKQGEQPPPAEPITRQNAVWSLQLRSEDNMRVAGFKNTAFSFSLLKPYSQWETFSQEALRIWEIHRSVARVEQVHRLGLRFINQIPLPLEPVELGDYLVNTPPDPKGIALPFATFLHQDTLLTPGYPYQINLIRTIRPPTDALHPAHLVIDIDVGTTTHPPMKIIETQLAEMRWLKNKLFFGIITEKALSLLR